MFSTGHEVLLVRITEGRRVMKSNYEKLDLFCKDQRENKYISRMAATERIFGAILGAITIEAITHDESHELLIKYEIISADTLI